MNSDEALNRMQRPEFGDVMSFEVTRDLEDDKTFSPHALEDLSKNMLMFMAARVKAQWEQTGEPPKQLHVDVRMRWSTSSDLEEGPWPWYKLADIDADGIHRRLP